MYFDSHCHIQFKAYKDDRDDVIARAKEADVLINAVGTQISTSRKAIELAEQYDHVYASVGIHPIQHDVVRVEEETTTFTSRGEQWDDTLFLELASHEKVIGIGETGLDKFHIREDKSIEDTFAAQRALFMSHYHLARKVEKALVIHVRDAHAEMISMLSDLFEKDGPVRGVIHCFTGNIEQAEQYLKFGLHLGFTGVITFPAKKTDPTPQEELVEVVKNMPFERMLIETDSPYLSPQSHRGERNEPAYVRDVAAGVAEIRGISVEEVMKQTTGSGFELFGIEK